MRGRGRLGDRLAVPAGELFADMLDDLPAPRLAFQGFRDHLAELVQPCAAALATGAGCGFDDPLDRHIVRQWPPRRPRIVCTLFLGGLRRSNLGLGVLFGLGLFKVLDRKLELLDQQLAALGGLPELLASRLRQHQLQSLDLEPADGDFALCQDQLLTLCKDHCMRSGKVGWKRIGGRRHDDNPTYSPLKIPPDFSRESKSHSLSGSLRTPGCLRHPPVNSRQEIG